MFGWLADRLAAKLTSENLVGMALLLATALGSALFVYWRGRERRSLRGFIAFAAPVDILTHPSARADFAFWLTRRAIMPLMIAGSTFVFGVAYATREVLSLIFHVGPPAAGSAGPFTMILFTASMLVAYDFSYYLYHNAQHRIPILWELHKVHHSAEVMVGVTKDRVHPLDEFMNRVWDGVIPGVCYGLWSLFVLDPVEVMVLGVNVYVMRDILMMDFVRHTHLPISYGRLNALMLPPYWHQLHHSVAEKHADKNFGLMFSFWDRLFGTLCIPEPGETFVFGCEGARENQSLWGLYVAPLERMWAVARRRLDMWTNPVLSDGRDP